MTTASVQYHGTAPVSTEHGTSLRRRLLTCGIAGAALCPLADIFAASRYPGFSYRDQASTGRRPGIHASSRPSGPRR